MVNIIVILQTPAFEIIKLLIHSILIIAHSDSDLFQHIYSYSFLILVCLRLLQVVFFMFMAIVLLITNFIFALIFLKWFFLFSLIFVAYLFYLNLLYLFILLILRRKSLLTFRNNMNHLFKLLFLRR